MCAVSSCNEAASSLRQWPLPPWLKHSLCPQLPGNGVRVWPITHFLSMDEARARLRRLPETWDATTANERASFQTWLIRCEALGVDTPDRSADGPRGAKAS